MALVARASKSVFRKNILIFVMCGVFLAMFGYDGFVGYPGANDRLVVKMRDEDPPRIDPSYKADLDNWKGWNHESAEAHEKMNSIVSSSSNSKNRAEIEGWKSPTDISVQNWIAVGLAAATAASVWWIVHCQKRRAIAEETTVSPAPGVVIPWDKITRVDNTRWKKIGIIEITYTDEQGGTRTAEFDDYKLDREPLLAILDQLADKAVNAEFIPKEVDAEATQPDAPS